MLIKRPEPYQPIPENATIIFEGKTMSVYAWEQELFDGKKTIYESTVRPDSVTVIPVTTEGKILLLNQIQSGFKNWFLSFPGGQIDESEGPEEAALRELLEETGYEAKELVLWDSLQPFTRMDWAVYTFIAHDCVKAGEMRLDGGEKMELREIDFDELLRLVEDDNFRHTDISLQILRMKLHKEKIETFRRELRM